MAASVVASTLGLELVRIDLSAVVSKYVGETEKNAMAGRQAGMHVAFPVLTETARSYTLTGATIPPGTLATTPRETTQVGFDGALYLQHPEPGQVVEVTGVCKAQLPKDLGSAQTVVSMACQSLAKAPRQVPRDPSCMTMVMR